MFGAALDLVFPVQCAGCGRVDRLLCTPCQEALRRPQPVCRQAPHIEGIYAAGVFDERWRAIIHAFKYEGQHALAATLSTLLPLPPEAPPHLLVIPVPLHPVRLRWRGYNQAALLARAFGAAHDLDVVQEALVRVRDTRPQVGLSAAARWRNVKDAFTVGTADIVGQDTLLIDDVFTTGATLAAGAAVLRRAGARSVWAVALACAA